MSFLIFEEQAGDKLKLVAEIEQDDTITEATEAVDALVDADKKFGGREFVVFDSDSREEVQAGEPIVRSQSKGAKRQAAPQRTRKPASKPAASKPRTTRKPAASKPAASKPAASRTTKKPASKPAAKPAAKKPAVKTGAAKPKGGMFKRNAKGDD